MASIELENISEVGDRAKLKGAEFVSYMSHYCFGKKPALI